MRVIAGVFLVFVTSLQTVAAACSP